MKPFQKKSGYGQVRTKKTYGGKSWDHGTGGGPGRPAMHAATCHACGNACQVPFKPTGAKPIFCNNCFTRHDDAAPTRHGEMRMEGAADGARSFTAKCTTCGSACEVPFRPNGKKPVYCSMCFTKSDIAPGANTNQFAEQLAEINMKLDAILEALTEDIDENES